MMDVVIRGDGVAAYGCAYLLRAAGIRAGIETADRPRLPVIMIGDATQALIRDVFGQQDLFSGLPRIHNRVVAWGVNAQPSSFRHSAVVVSEEILLERLHSKLLRDDAPAPKESAWAILSSPSLLPVSREHHFGSRVAQAVKADLKPSSNPVTCWIESLESGWLFLLPCAGGSGWLLSVGSAPEFLLGHSRLVGGQVANLSGPVAQFPAYPRITWPLCGPGWLACGTAAMAFDPLCGDGSGNSIREAILASAVVRAIRQEDSADQVLDHYQARLAAGFKRHLAHCREFYASGNRGPWWDRELDHLDRGLAWCRRQLGSETEFRYRLIGFDLRPV
jgi:hypothetical protein